MGNPRLEGDPELDRQAIAVILARGTGDQVPLLSARLLAGKPVLHYIIDAAQKSEFVRQVYVSTEDERIAAIAEAAGSEVILRPESLSLQQSPINASIVQAANVLSEPLSSVGGHLLCLTADAIFCDTPLIDRALKAYFSSDYDQLIGLLPETKKYVIWRQGADQHMESLVPPPLSRPSTEQLFSEPGVLTIWRLGPKGLPAETERIGYVTLEQRNAFRVNTEYDLWVAERLLAPSQLALRCDGSRQMGMGHIMRMLNIAEHLRREDESAWTIRFFIGSDHLEGAHLVTERGFDADIVRQHDTSHWVQRVEAFNPSVIINDLPFVPASYTEQLCDLPAKSLTIVDSVADIEPGDGRLDTVVSLLDEDLGRPHGDYHHGLAFATFDPSVVAHLKHRPIDQVRDEGLRVLVAFGIGDPARLSQPALAALAESQHHWERVTVVVQPDQQDGLFEETAKRLRCPVEIVDAPSERLGDLLNQSDLALVSGGITAYESSALGVPAIVLCQNQRERTRMEQFERIGSILLLGMGTEVTRAQLVRALNRLAADPGLREHMANSARQTMDGRGVERISQIVRELFGKQASPAG